MDETESFKVELPGFGLPIDHDYETDEPYVFPVLQPMPDDEGWKSLTLTIREKCMLAFIEEITNKPEWWNKVKDETISTKWKKEALANNWSFISRFADFTEAMADACIEELVHKADIYEKTGLIPVFDYSAAVVKSDKLMPDDLVASLKDAVSVLENVPEKQKDWHPGSNNQVLDLVHPSLWPLIYGRSRILPDKEINLDNCLQHCGAGEVVPVPDLEETEEQKAMRIRFGTSHKPANLSEKFQWLPCKVNLDQGKAKIVSYINNLHPQDHANMYPIIERFIDLALPAWDLLYRWPDEFQKQRIVANDATYECSVPKICGNYCRRINCPRNDNGELQLHITTDDHVADKKDNQEDNDEESDGEDRDEEEYELEDDDPRNIWFHKTHPINLPTTAEPLSKPSIEDIKTTDFFDGKSNIQVVVKLANIHLTPENPTYEGGSWHLEGQLNEHICSTALFYYDSDNITDCRLQFRTVADQEEQVTELNYEQSDMLSIQRTFAINMDTTLQEIGGTLTREGRSLFFSNVYQHQVGSFKLADPTKPGHRKILALFLVDPATPVISTANVPPQQRQWWARAAGVNSIVGNAVDVGGKPEARTKSRFPMEVTEMVMDHVDFPISLEDAKEIREQLMAERKVLVTTTNDEFQGQEWNFCEH